MKKPLLRKSTSLFSIGLFAVIAGLMVSGCSKEGSPEDSPAQATPRAFNADDLDGKTFAILTGSIWDTLLNENIPGAVHMYFNSMPEAEMAVIQGKAYATFVGTTMLHKYEVIYPDLEFLHPAVFEADTAFMFGKDKSELRDSFNSFLREIRDDGTYADMESRWLGNLDPPDMPDIPSSGEKGTLIFATTGTSDLFSYIKNGKLTGLEVELAYRFAAHIGMKLQTEMMDFSGIIPYVQSGKADFAGAGFVITEERKQSVDFSDTVYEDGLVVAVRRETLAAAPGFLESIKTGFERNLIHEGRWKMIVDGLRVSIIITLLAFALATLLGFGVCGLRMSKNRILSAIGGAYVTVLRGTPVLVLLMITFYVIFAKSSVSGTAVAVIAFGANGAAFIGEIVRSAILTVDKGQVEAARSMGFSKAGAFFTVTFPQAVRVAFPVYMSEFISLFKMTSVVGYIAIVDLTKAGDIIRSRTYDAFFPLIMVALVYLITASAMIWLLNFVNKKTDKRLRSAK